MTSRVIDRSPANVRAERYAQAERALWDHYGLAPVERFVELRDPPVRLRVLEVGSGEPLLFVHGTVASGSWPSLMRERPGVRSAGHMPWFDDATRVAADVVRFLATTS